MNNYLAVPPFIVRIQNVISDFALALSTHTSTEPIAELAERFFWVSTGQLSLCSALLQTGTLSLGTVLVLISTETYPLTDAHSLLSPSTYLPVVQGTQAVVAVTVLSKRLSFVALTDSALTGSLVRAHL